MKLIFVIAFLFQACGAYAGSAFVRTTSDGNVDVVSRSGSTTIVPQSENYSYSATIAKAGVGGSAVEVPIRLVRNGNQVTMVVDAYNITQANPGGMGTLNSTDNIPESFRPLSNVYSSAIVSVSGTALATLGRFEIQSTGGFVWNIDTLGTNFAAGLSGHPYRATYSWSIH